MLQKLLVVLVGLVMSLVGALSPAGLFAAEPIGDFSTGAAAAKDATLATVRTLDGAAFTRVSVLWVEVDGRRVTDDAWGTGSIEQLQFKVGVKNVDDLALAVGDRLVPLNPTDVVTVRMFNGEFAYRDMGSSKATLQLQGTVKTTTLADGALTNKVRTEGTNAETAEGSVVRDARQVAYVVLNTGKKVDTVALQTGGARIFTEEAASAKAARNEAGNLLAKWVKIDGKLIQEYTWGDGPINTVEFEPANAGEGSVVLAFNGNTGEASAGSRVLVRDFVGEYLVYQVAGGLSRLRLDGFAADYKVGAASSVAAPLGTTAPIAAFDYTPASPKTTDTIKFTDRSTDDTLVVFRMWQFGDEATSVQPNPSYRFTTPGVYRVVLNVTDSDRETSETAVLITVRNSEPVSDFDFWPKDVTTQTLVAFTDESRDPDGRIVSYAWDFGDGTTSTAHHPRHNFSASGPATVTLTTTDNLGASSSISKVIVVRNTPPLAQFDYSPNQVQTLAPVQFNDRSVDRDGVIVSQAWNFGDGTTATGLSPVHTFPRPGLYTVSLTVTDNGGAKHTTSTQLFVENRLPIVNFTWAPFNQTSDKPVHFTSLSSDPDGTILLYQWDFGDGTSQAFEPNPTHVFPRAGAYQVTLTVTDNTLGINSTSMTVGIANALPRAAMTINPNPAFRDLEVVFADVSTDPDGDAIVNRTWQFGPTDPIHYSQVVRRSYADIGNHTITLTVRDSAGNSASTSQILRVSNRPPVMDSLTATPQFALVGSNVTFAASGHDIDARPGDGPLRYRFAYSDGVVAEGVSPNHTRTFQAPGIFMATVSVIDGQAAASNPLTIAVSVDFAPPVPDFLFTALNTPILVGDRVTFVDTSTSPNGPIVTRRWDFKDNTQDIGAVVNHTFAVGGSYLVTLNVTDNRSKSADIQRSVFVNTRPVAAFDVDHLGTVPLNVQVQFTDRSTDADNDALTYSWNFDDGPGAVSTDRDPRYAFQTPGTHNVTLTVTDEHGTSANTTKVLRIQNTRPVARWLGPLELLSGELGTFTSQSYDPDGTALVSWDWNMGDGTLKQGAVVQHAYAKSGSYVVQLVVSDGELTSRIDTQSVKTVRVLASHDVILNVGARLPNNLPADLMDPAFTISATIASSGISPRFVDAFVPNASAPLTKLYNLESGRWARGDTVTVRMSAPSIFPGELAQTHVLGEEDGISRSVRFTFDLPAYLASHLTPTYGGSNTFVDVPGVIQNKNHTSEGDPVYRSMNEPFRGTGRVTFVDGATTPIANATVFLEARYVPFRILGGLREGLTAPNSDLLGWCQAGTYFTNSTGEYAWTVDGRGTCTMPDMGLYPVGRWELRARAAYGFATSAVSDVATVYVDPTGGLLWAASAPP